MKTIPIVAIKNNQSAKVSWEVSPKKQWVKDRELADRAISKKEKPIVYEKSQNYIKKAQNGEPIPLIILNYDYLCNFQCDHCCADLFMNKTAKAEKADTRRKLNPQDVKMIADQADEMGIGQFVLSGGEPAALILIDAIVRLLTGTMGSKESLIEESFENNLLEYPQYTRPFDWEGMKPPEVLLSGNHSEIEKWRRYMALEDKKKRRPELLISEKK